MSNISKEDARRHRVVNLLSRMDTKNMTMQQWAVRRLLEWQPGAVQIRFEGRCAISKCQSKHYLSYQLLGDMAMNEREEFCGYYCPSCQFSSAGSRMIKRGNK